MIWIILKIKVWNSGEEPEVVLGRAIEPPYLKHIDKALVNLKNYGALTVTSENCKSGILTDLGKVYSELPIDIKYSRLIMLCKNQFILIKLFNLYFRLCI